VALTRDQHVEAYRLMVTSRLFDEECTRLLEDGVAVPHYHSGVGQEALMVASVLPLRQSDKIIYTHRGYGHLLAKGVPLDEIALDMFMKRGGTNYGLGGVMHVSRPDLGVPGREGVFGTRFGLATGLGLAASLKDDDAVTVCFYGEAAGARGILYEALNMCKLWKLPVVFVAENNGWSFTSRTEWLFPSSQMSDVWRGFVPVEVVDGNDTEAVWDAVSGAVDQARAGAGPSVVEGMTYRVDPHIWFDRADYQPADEIAQWRERDPVSRSRTRLVELGVDDPTLKAVHDQAEQEVLSAFAAVSASEDATWADSPEWEVTR
jgi:TPP-dependent pyruvate/acetoin dehydrogenase alpha subunit